MRSLRTTGRWALALGLLIAAEAEVRAADVVLDNVQLKAGEVLYRAPKLEVRGTGLSRDELAALFDPAAPATLDERIRKLDASSITAPEVVGEVTTPQGPQVTTYRDVVFTSVRGGQIQRVSAAGGTTEAALPNGKATGRFGRFDLADLRLDLVSALFLGRAGSDAGLQPIHGAYSLDGLSITDPNGVTTKLGRMSGRDVRAKPTRAGWMSTFNTIAGTPDFKAASREARTRSVEAMAELLDSFSIGAVEASDLEVSGPGMGRGRIARVSFRGSEGGRGAEVRLDGFEAAGKEASARFASLSLGGLSLAPMVGMLREIAAASDGDPGPAILRKLLTLLDSLSLNGFEVELPPASSVQRGAGMSPRVSVGGVELAAERPVEDIPTDIRIAVRGLAFPVPANPDSDPLKQLAELGYGRAGGSLVLSLGWSEGRQELQLRELSVDGLDMGQATVRATLGGVGRDLFSPDTAVASVAALGANARSAEITVDNRGLFERIVAREAKRQKRSPEDIRREYGVAAAVGIPALLGNSPNAKLIAQALARFVAKPGRLAITARAKGAGFGVADFSAAPDPAAVLNALEITATAE